MFDVGYPEYLQHLHKNVPLLHKSHHAIFAIKKIIDVTLGY